MGPPLLLELSLVQVTPPAGELDPSPLLELAEPPQ